MRLEDIARELGVSTSTVSRALTDNPSISKPMRSAVKALALERGYTAAPRKRQTREPQLTIVMPPYSPQHLAGITEPFILNLLGGIVGAMRERGLTFHVSHRVARDNATLKELMDESPHDGFIFLGQSQFHAALNDQAKLERAFVVWGAERPDQTYCSVGSDNFHGGFRATSHLIRLGRRQVAFVGNPAYFEVADRLEGYRAALRAHGLEPCADLLLTTELGIEEGLGAAEDLLSSGVQFDAVIAATDMLAFGLIRGLAKYGKQVPRDISVIGYDDLDSAKYSSPALTTVRQDPLKAARLLTHKLVRQMGGQRAASERIAPELIVRESCGA